MEKTILIAGKEIPEGSDFASGAALNGRNVVITSSSPATATADSAEQINEENGSYAVVWNRASPISARSLILACENKYDHLDEAVLIFDEPLYASKYGRLSAEDCAVQLDDMIAGYQYLAMEILARFEQKKMGTEDTRPGKLVFLHKTNPTMCDAVHSPSVRTQTESLSTPLVASSAAAFDAFAQNMAAVSAVREDAEIILVTCDKNNEAAQKDNTLASWLCKYLDTIDALKNKISAKQSVSWIKAGAKGPGMFGLFK